MKHFKFSTLLVLFIIFIFGQVANAQVPEMFNYQAVARDNATGEPIQNTTLSVRIAILSSIGPDVVVWEEEHSVISNEFGLFTLTVGDLGATMVAGSVGSFSAIDWTSGNYYLRPSVMPSGGMWNVMPAAKLITVPFAMMAKDSETRQQLTKSGDFIILSDGGSVDISEYTDPDQSISLAGNTLTLSNGGSVSLGAYVNQFEADNDTLFRIDGSLVVGSSIAGGSKLAVVSSDDTSEDALFEVKRADGQTVFAVYPEAVRMYVAKGDPQVKAPGTRGGFAVAGFDKDKATPLNDLLWLTPDSVRFYIDDTQTVKAPGTRGGFAVAGFDKDKAPGVQFMNISGSNTPDVIPPSSQILFYPLKDALLAGYVGVEDPQMVGLNSASIGYQNVASGQYSQAFGYLSQADADYAMAVGNTASASGESSFAFGEGAVATGLRSYAMGFYSNASGTQTYAIGKQSNASGSESLALGFSSQALALNSVAMGALAEAHKQRSTAIGYDAVANGDNSLSIGYETATTGTGSAAIGYQSVATGVQSTALSGGSSGGDYSFSAGIGSSAGGLGAVSIGQFNQANAQRAVVLGSWGQANGDGSGWFGTDHIFVVGNGNGAYSNAMEILKNGNVGIGAEPGDNKLYVAGDLLATGTITPSDLTLKTNIKEIASASDKIKEINGVSFDYRTDEYPKMGLPGGMHYGVIAQELRLIFPELVKEGSDGILAVSYTELIPILIEAFKEQETALADKQSQIDYLELENAEIRSRLDALEAAVNSMLEK